METTLVGRVGGGTRTTVVPGASPAVVQNTLSTAALYMVIGGTVTVIEFSRDGATFDISGVISG